MIGYRIVEVKNGKVFSLFHGTKRSREIFLDVWNVADQKLVTDGSHAKKSYLSGWHFLETEEAAHKFFMEMFRVKENRRVIKCEVRGDIRPKHPDGKGKPCFLANEIFINSAEVKGECLVN